MMSSKYVMTTLTSRPDPIQPNLQFLEVALEHLLHPPNTQAWHQIAETLIEHAAHQELLHETEIYVVTLLLRGLQT